jgi:hypothetical protein
LRSSGVTFWARVIFSPLVSASQVSAQADSTLVNSDPFRAQFFYVFDGFPSKNRQAGQQRSVPNAFLPYSVAISFVLFQTNDPKQIFDEIDDRARCATCWLTVAARRLSN